MFQGADDLLAYIKDEEVETVDVRFCDLPGVMQHFTVPASFFDASVIERREATPSKDSGKGTSNGSPTRVEVQLTDPPVTAWVPMDASPGDVVRVRLDSVDPRHGTASFVPAGDLSASADGDR